ncbi:MAG: thymidine kinase [Clostridium sp.]|jgi:thymidine kinase|nr:thymidine kinase [Clostridium sp.]
MAKLYFRYGAMNSGKSTALMQVAFNYEERGMNVFLIKPQIDAKGGHRLISRIGIERNVDYMSQPEDDLFKIIADQQAKKTTHCILVDEAQFLKTEQVDQLMSVTIQLKIPVIAYGLRTDFSTIGFEGAQRLLLLAHSIEEMKTICTCGRKATFNGRKLYGEFVFEGEQVAIDNQAEVEYQSLCSDCYFRLKKEYEEKKRIKQAEEAKLWNWSQK